MLINYIFDYGFYTFYVENFVGLYETFKDKFGEHMRQIFLIGDKERFIDEYLFMIFSRDLEKSKIFIGKI